MPGKALQRLYAQDEKPQTYKDWVARVIEDHRVDTFIVILVVCDLICVALEAGIDGHLLCIGGKEVHTENDHVGGEVEVGFAVAKPKFIPHSLLAVDSITGQGHGSHHGETVLLCETSEGHTAHHIMHFCHVCSVTILCIFMVELLLKCWVNPREFWRSWFHRLDVFVVSVSLLLDAIVVPYLESQNAEEDIARQREGVEIIAFCLIFSRTWRIVRICHGFFEQYAYFDEAAEKVREENGVYRRAMVRVGLDPEKELARQCEREKFAPGMDEGVVY